MIGNLSHSEVGFGRPRGKPLIGYGNYPVRLREQEFYGIFLLKSTLCGGKIYRWYRRVHRERHKKGHRGNFLLAKVMRQLY